MPFSSFLPVPGAAPVPNVTPRRRAATTEAEPPPSSDQVRLELQGELDRIGQAGRDLCHLMGITDTWGTARWEAGPTPDTLTPTYRVVVQGELPGPEVTNLIVARLTRHGWSGVVPSLDPVLRLDATRASTTMRLTIEGGSVRLKVGAAPVRLGRHLATWILAGVYEEDEIA